MTASGADSLHRHGRRVHRHPHAGPHRHLALLPYRSEPVAHEHHDHAYESGHGHSHGFVDRSNVRSQEGIKAVSISLSVLAVATAAQLVVFVLSHSIALLADLIHNGGDALTALPLGVAFFLRSFRGEKIAGLFVVFTIFVSACVALYETIQRFIHPQHLSHLWALAAAGVIGFVGNEIAADGGSTAPPSSPTATTRASTASSRSPSSRAPRRSRSAGQSPIRSSDS